MFSRKKGRSFIAVGLVLLLCMGVSQVMAQGDGGGEDPDVPIDGGLSLLLAAGVTYGTRRILSSKRHTFPEERE